MVDDERPTDELAISEYVTDPKEARAFERRLAEMDEELHRLHIELDRFYEEAARPRWWMFGLRTVVY